MSLREEELFAAPQPFHWMSRQDIIEHAMDAALVEGYILDFGVAGGQSTEIIAGHTKQIVYGFDSFDGLPEDWIRDDNPPTHKAGKFALHGKMPNAGTLANVVLVKGLFSDTVARWAGVTTERPSVINFIHMDCDLYSSTKTVLTELNHMIIPGTVILFDEIGSFEESENAYPRWREGEWRALNEWLDEAHREARFLFRDTGFRAAIIVEK